MPHKSSILISCVKSSKAIYVVVACLVAYLGINPMTLLAYFFFIALDTILGVSRSISINKRSFTSSLAYSGLGKKIGITFLALGIVFFGQSLELHFLDAIGTVIFAIFTGLEIYSCVAHIVSIQTGENMDEDLAMKYFFKELLALIRETIPMFFGSLKDMIKSKFKKK